MKITAKAVHAKLEKHLTEEFKPLQIEFEARTGLHEENNKKQREIALELIAREEKDKKRDSEIVELKNFAKGVIEDLKAIREAIADSRATARWLIGLSVQILSPLITILGAMFILGKMLGKS